MRHHLLVASGALAMTINVVACSSPEPPASAPALPASTTAEVSGIASRHAIVTLLPAGAADAPPQEPAVMDQRSKQFLPAVLIAHVGQPVEFRNSEDMPHNVAVSRRESGTEIFNVGTEPHQKYVYTFDRVGQFEVKCDIHEGMEATVIVAKGPQTLIADDGGQFVFSNVMPGSYTVSITFAGQTVERALDVKAPKTSFNLNAK